MIPTWSASTSTSLALYPLPIGQAQVRTAQAGIVPTVGFSHNGSFSLALGQPFYRATDVNHFVRFRGGMLHVGMYLNVRIQAEPCGGSSINAL